MIMAHFFGFLQDNPYILLLQTVGLAAGASGRGPVAGGVAGTRWRAVADRVGTEIVLTGASDALEAVLHKF